MLFDAPSPILAHRPTLAGLAAEGIYLGTSSWKYEGWLGQVYDPQRYLVRGRVSSRVLADHCLEEYAEIFPSVCVDAGFYRFPDPAWIDRLGRQVPEGFRLSFKVTDAITLRRFPVLPRHGASAGKTNPSFLDAGLFMSRFLDPVSRLGPKLGLLIFEFTCFRPRDFARGREFVERLDRFLGDLPGGWDYGVELRNPNLLQPEYFEVLQRRGVAHVYNQWHAMPGAGAQWRSSPPDPVRQPVGARFLLKSGRAYEAAVDAFSPYSEIREPLPEVREAMATMIGDLRRRPGRRRAYIYVNNRLEGNAPSTIAAVLDLVARQGRIENLLQGP